MSTENTTEKEYPSDLFVERLQHASRGDLAILKRAAGFSISESLATMKAFYQVLPPSVVGTKDEEIYFLVATLYAFNKYKIGENFGESMRLTRVKSSSGSIDKRMAALLNSNFAGEELGYRLRQCVKLVASKEVGVNWKMLLRDLLHWNHPDRYVQKSWARAYFSRKEENGSVKPTNNQ